MIDKWEELKEWLENKNTLHTSWKGDILDKMEELDNPKVEVPVKRLKNLIDISYKSHHSKVDAALIMEMQEIINEART